MVIRVMVVFQVIELEAPSPTLSSYTLHNADNKKATYFQGLYGPPNRVAGTVATEYSHRVIFCILLELKVACLDVSFEIVQCFAI